MMAYRKFCERMGVSPVWYGVACVVGALGSIAVILVQRVEGYESVWFWFTPLVYAPFMMVEIPVRRKSPPSERARKLFRGFLVTAALSFLPGALIAAAVEEWLW